MLFCLPKCPPKCLPNLKKEVFSGVLLTLIFGVLYRDFQWALRLFTRHKKSPQMGYFSGIGRFWGVFLKVNYGIAIFSLKNTPFPLRHIYGKLRYFVPFILSAFSAFSFVTILFLIFYDWIFVACLVCFYLSFIQKLHKERKMYHFSSCPSWQYRNPTYLFPISFFPKGTNFINIFIKVIFKR